MVEIKIDEALCIRDGLCSNICPLQIILPPVDGGIPQSGPDFSGWCISCGHCVAICPTGALQHSRMTAAQCSIANYELVPSLEQVEQGLRLRRSTRRFKETAPEKELIERLVGLTAYAPTGHNMQAVKWLVFSCRDDLEQLVEMVCDWMSQVLADTPDVVQAPMFRKIVKARDRGGDYILHNAPVLILSYSRLRTGAEPTAAAIAQSYIDSAASSLGLGCCWAGLFKMAVKSWKPLRQFIDLPEGCHLHEALIMGYPKYEFKRIPLRKSPKIEWR